MNKEMKNYKNLKLYRFPPKLQNWSLLIKEDSELTEEKENHNNFL